MQILKKHNRSSSNGCINLGQLIEAFDKAAKIGLSTEHQRIIANAFCNKT